jgi:hypothetical protein
MANLSSSITKKKAYKLLFLSPRFGAALIAFLFFILYLLTAPRVNVSYADSDFLTVVGHNLGLAHPPGYPWYMVLVYIFTHLPIAGTVAWKANILSVLLHSLTLGIVFLSSWEIVDYFKRIKKWSFLNLNTQWLISFLSTLMLGSSYLFWLYGEVAEKYALNDLLIVLVIYLGLRILNKKKLHEWWWIGLVMGFGMLHHQTIVLLTPAILGLAKIDRKNWQQQVKIASLIFVGICFVGLALIAILNTRNVPVSWRFVPTLNGWWGYLSRKDFSGYLITTGEWRGMYIMNLNLHDMIVKVPIVIHTYLQHFGWLALGLWAVGCVALWKLDKKMAKWLGFLALFTTIFIPLYIPWPNDLSAQAIRLRMYLEGYVVMPMVITVGLLVLMSFVNQTFKKLNLNFIVAFLFLISLYRMSVVYGWVDLSKFDLVAKQYNQILESVPKNSLIACMSDVSCFAMLYHQQIDQVRSDVIILPQADNIVMDIVSKKQKLKGFDLQVNPEKYLDYITWNFGKRPVIVTELQRVYYDFLEIDYGFVKYIPRGYYGELTTKNTEQNLEEDYQFSDLLTHINFPEVDLMRQQLKASIAQKHLLNARILKLENDSENKVAEEIDWAKKISQGLPTIYLDDVTKFEQQIIQIKKTIYVPGKINPNNNEVLNQAEQYVALQDLNMAYKGIAGVLYQEPTNERARLMLANFYEMINQKSQAYIEYINILKYHPENMLAKVKIGQLKQFATYE